MENLVRSIRLFEYRKKEEIVSPDNRADQINSPDCRLGLYANAGNLQDERIKEEKADAIRPEREALSVGKFHEMIGSIEKTDTKSGQQLTEELVRN